MDCPRDRKKKAAGVLLRGPEKHRLADRHASQTIKGIILKDTARGMVESHEKDSHKNRGRFSGAQANKLTTITTV